MSSAARGLKYTHQFTWNIWDIFLETHWADINTLWGRLSFTHRLLLISYSLQIVTFDSLFFIFYYIWIQYRVLEFGEGLIGLLSPAWRCTIWLFFHRPTNKEVSSWYMDLKPLLSFKKFESRWGWEEKTALAHLEVRQFKDYITKATKKSYSVPTFKEKYVFIFLCRCSALVLCNLVEERALLKFIVILQEPLWKENMARDRKKVEFLQNHQRWVHYTLSVLVTDLHDLSNSPYETTISLKSCPYMVLSHHDIWFGQLDVSNKRKLKEIK